MTLLHAKHPWQEFTDQNEVRDEIDLEKFLALFVGRLESKLLVTSND
jgi:hypothetical protein